MPYQAESKQIYIKFKKVYEHMLKRKDQHFVQFGLRHIMLKWHEQAKRGRKACNALAKGVQQLMLQNGFNQIRDVVREKTKNNVKFKWALKIYKLYK